MSDQLHVVTAETPAGIEVRYTVGDRVRKYEVCTEAMADEPLAWREVPSVTTVLGVLDKPLQWWGMEIGVAGVQELVRLEAIETERFPDGNGGKVGFGSRPVSDGEPLSKEAIVGLLTAHKLTVNHVRDKAADRGTAVHDAFETWCRTGFKPDPSLFLEADRGYINGLLKFLEDAKGVEPLACEVMVGSVEHGFAGRYDVRLKFWEDCEVVYHRTPKRGPKYATIEAGTTALGDLKTSKSVYLSHSKQLEAYELASVECGYEPTDARGILHVSAEGEYEFVRSVGVAHDFLTTLAEWKSQEDMKGRKAK